MGLHTIANDAWVRGALEEDPSCRAAISRCDLAKMCTLSVHARNHARTLALYKMSGRVIPPNNSEDARGCHSR